MAKLEIGMFRMPRLNSLKFPSQSNLWLAFFLYTLIVGVLIQFIILPYVSPQWNSGNGLFLHLDSVGNHEDASEKAQLISEQGWSAWDLPVDGQGTLAITSAVYAAISPQPWTLLPLNAALQATGALFLLLTFRILTESNWYSLLASLPFLVFPSSLAWTSQILNDSYAATGTVLFLYGWVAFSSEAVWHSGKRTVTAVLSIAAGLVLVWLVRPFLLELYLVFGLIYFLTFTGIRLWSLLRDRRRWQTPMAAFVLLALVLILLNPVAIRSGRRREAVVPLPDQSASSLETFEAVGGDDPDQSTPEDAISKSVGWNVSGFLPNVLESRLRSLSVDRLSNTERWKEAGSNLDVEIQFQSALELIQYTPRAIQVGLLAPFPSMWVGPGRESSSFMIRIVGGLEMAIIYVILIALPYSLWHWRKSPGMWTMLSFCLGMTLIYVIATPNIGTLMRFRYAYLMPIVGLGVAGWADLVWRTRLAYKSSDRQQEAA